MEFYLSVVAAGIAAAQAKETLIRSDRDAVDFIATVRYQTDCDKVILPMQALPQDFFLLRTGLAGAVLQKFITYGMKLAVVGDLSAFADNSKALHDFIYESNNGTAIFFVSTTEEAVEKLSAV